jgi:peptidoglycan/LPS O-acetylase OafA/YrhL
MADTFRIRGFDGLRAIAVGLVILQHKTHFGKADVGAYGVWLFFVLSGFLIIGILYAERGNIEAGAISVGDAIRVFMLRRSLRIFPIYYLTLLATMPIFLAGVHHDGRAFSPDEALFNFFYLSNFWIGNYVQGTVGSFSHLWSLSIEEQFYLISAPLFLVSSRHRSVQICAAICAIGLIAKLVLELHHAPTITITTNSLINFSLIAYGGICILYVIPGKPAPGGRTLTAPILLCLYLILPFVIQHLPIDRESQTYSQFAPLLVGPLLISIYKNQRQPLVRLLDLWPLRTVGQMSYGIYLYHNFVYPSFVITPIEELFGVSIQLSKYADFSISVIMTLVAATLSWNYIEKPLLKLRPQSFSAPELRLKETAVARPSDRSSDDHIGHKSIGTKDSGQSDPAALSNEA